MTLFQSIIVLVASFVGIILSANALINNGIKIASIYKVSPFIIGILILGFGTSAPEIFVSTFAAFENSPNLAVGNAFGSNILNLMGYEVEVAASYPNAIEVVKKLIHDKKNLDVLYSGILLYPLIEQREVFFLTDIPEIH